MVAKRTDPAMAAVDWLPDDTEESVVGTQRHQKAISLLADMLEALRDAEGAAWDVVRNMGFTGFTRRDGTAYAPMPDVCLHPRRLPLDVTAVSLAEYGPPWLVIEVASPSTVAADLGEKAATYARGGVAEYLVFDGGAALLPAGQVWACRLDPAAGGTLQPWWPAPDGRWHSALGLALAPDGPLLLAYDRHGAPLLTGREANQQRLEEHRRRLDAERQRLDAEARAAALEAELRRLRGTDP